MWYYEKKLQYPANVSRTDLGMAKYLFAQFGGPDSELSAAIRYLSQRYTMPIPQAKATLTDIGTEELAHWEIIATLIYKLTDGATPEEMRRAGLGAHFAQHDRALFPHDASGVPWTAAYIQSPEILSRIFTKTWRQNRKPAPLMSGSSVSPMMWESLTPFPS